MKTLSPKKINILTAFIASALFMLLSVILLWDVLTQKWSILLTVSLSLFLLIFWITTYFTNKFYVDIIKPIYRIIRTVNANTIEISEDLEDAEFTKNLGMEVDLWAKEKTKQITQLRQMEKYRKEFLGDVSHELKTPIFTIQGYISTLIDGGLNDPNINMKYLVRTEKSIDRMISIVEDLISISRLESGELILNIERFDIMQVVREIVEMQDVRASAKGINLSVLNNESDQYYVKADKKLIYQVILNLVVNSINYGQENGLTEIKLYPLDKIIMVEVSDNGIGIADKDLPRIFERFYRVDKSRSKELGGTGLGLSICKHIVEAHKQTINVSSKIGRGSSFTFTLDEGEHML
ncbi:MAG: sensor histidine kinase [Bacteroidales bacterium]|nr:sensor histidine kinase [Bacteroidales bacterium]